MSKTNIPYADESCNVVVGCTPCSPACDNCWSEELHNQRYIASVNGKKIPEQYNIPFGEIQLLPERLEELKHLRKPRTIFMCSGSDLFHEDVDTDFIWKVFEAMLGKSQHTFLVLTKRITRAQEIIKNIGFALDYNNIILGISIWNQESADRDIPILLDCWKGRTWISAEPLLGEIDLEKWLLPQFEHLVGLFKGTAPPHIKPNFIVIGCESGRNRRPCKDEWLDSIAEQCKQANVPCLIKQHEFNGKIVACKPHKDFFRR